MLVQQQSTLQFMAALYIFMDLVPSKHDFKYSEFQVLCKLAFYVGPKV